MRLFARVGGVLLGSTLLAGCFSPLTTLPEPPDAWGPAGAGDLAACDSALQLGSYCAPESRSAVLLPEPEATPVAERPAPGGDEAPAAPPVEVPAWFPIDVPAAVPTPTPQPAATPIPAPDPGSDDEADAGKGDRPKKDKGKAKHKGRKGD